MEIEQLKHVGTKKEDMGYATQIVPYQIKP